MVVLKLKGTGLVGSKPTGSLVPIKKFCWLSACGPPWAPFAVKSPARKSKDCALDNPISNATMACCWAAVSPGAAP